MSVDYDVVIAGGGMVGISFALALEHLSAGQLRILVVESFAIPAANRNSAPAYRPSFDARATALSYGSRRIFENIGIWPLLETHTSAIENIHVSERGHFGSATLNTVQRAWPALGYVVENAWLGNVLLNVLRQRPAITLLSPAKVVDCIPGAEHATVIVENNQQQQSFSTHLLSIADGANSNLRTRLCIGNTTHDYDRQAIIANISCARPHSGWAYERFTDWGPMALLPLSDSEAGQPRMALVWTMTGARAADLLECTDKDFLAALQQRFGQRQGRFIRVGERGSYDLKLVTADEQVRRQCVLIGNAAHSLHPVAGQGFNLALRDILRLAKIIADANAARETIGELNVLQRYAAQQAGDQWKTILFSDRITALFEQPNLFAGGLRRIGLTMLDLNTDWKNYFIDHSAGYQPGAALGV
ncbi:MAG TPA: 2-octaprenyl-6-methoxyphenyl hydroxylase [Spongiibacteraceae bacterium]|nr:2-octaprenyl-6-methoxyphenyl hydroxylase [Spongiibacteraceae bacterium]